MSAHTDPRIDLARHAGAHYAALVRVEERIQLDPGLRLLVKLRASQINGCAYCIDMHWTEARAHGDPSGGSRSSAPGPRAHTSTNASAPP